MNFFDPKWTSDGKPFGPYKYKELVKQLYIITKACNTSYTDLLNITPTERDIILEMLMQEREETNKAVADMKSKHQTI